MAEKITSATGTNRAKLYQLALFPLNNGATNVYFVLILSYVAQFGSSVLKLGMYASIMVTVMRVFDAVTDPIIGALMDRTSTRIGKLTAPSLLTRRFHSAWFFFLEKAGEIIFASSDSENNESCPLFILN